MKEKTMKKQKVLSKLSDCGVVAVVRADSGEEAVKISDACVVGGIKGIEVTFTVAGADEVIKELDLRRVDRAAISKPIFNGKTGMSYHGYISKYDFIFHLWTYSDFYEDKKTKKVHTYLDSLNTIMLPSDFKGVMAHAGVTKATKKGLRVVKGEFVYQDIIDEDKALHKHKVMSAPLAIPISIDKIFRIKQFS